MIIQLRERFEKTNFPASVRAKVKEKKKEKYAGTVNNDGVAWRTCRLIFFFLIFLSYRKSLRGRQAGGEGAEIGKKTLKRLYADSNENQMNKYDGILMYTSICI